MNLPDSDWGIPDQWAFLANPFSSLLLYLVLAICLFVIARKERDELAVLAFIPLANLYLLTRLADRDWWWLILYLIPCVNYVVFIMDWWRILEKRGRSGWWAVAMIIPCFALITPIVAATGD